MDSRLKPNVLFIFADQFRAAAMPSEGDPNTNAPNLLKLAEEGVAMTRAYSNNPVCGPARASMITGLYPHIHGVVRNDFQLSTDFHSIAQVFRDNGYKTGYIGKWHLDGGDEKPGFVPPGPRRRGFDYWAAFNCGHKYWDSKYFLDTEEPISGKGYEPDYQTDLAVDFMARHKDEPFCLFMSWGPPHTPFYPPNGVYDENWSSLKPEALQLRANVPAEEEEKARLECAGYYSHIHALDVNMGKIMNALEHLSLGENTILVFTSDHGDMLGSHGLYRKSRPFEESIHIPFLIRYPRELDPGVRNETMFSIVDFMPTLLSLAGLPLPEGLQGTDVAQAMLRNDAALGPDSVYMEGRIGRDQEFRTLRTPQFMLTVDAKTLKTEFMYDTTADPLQVNNLAGCPEYAELERQLRGRLLEWAEQTRDADIMSLKDLEGGTACVGS